MKANKVNLFVIGVNKAGSSWLYYLLNEHPEIHMSEIKELYYFDEKYPEELDEYHTNFPLEKDYKYFGEATPTYYRKRSTAQNIKKYSPEAKVLAIIRDPIQRLRSQFYYHKQLGIIPEKTSLEEAIEDKDSHLIQDSHYEKTLPKFQEVFGSNFKVLSLEHSIDNTDEVWEELQDFLGIMVIGLPELSRKSENATGSSLFRKIYKFTIRPIKRKSPKLYKKLLQMKTMRKSKKTLLKILGKADKKEISEELYAKLEQEFLQTYQYLQKLGFEKAYK